MVKLDTFTRSYIETALWSSTDDNETPLDSNYSIDDIAPEALELMAKHCASFQESNAELIDGNDAQAGHDFWLTRNRHGAGFWDGDWPKEIGKKLTDAAHAYGEQYLFIGNDGRIYVG